MENNVICKFINPNEPLLTQQNPNEKGEKKVNSMPNLSK